MYQQTLDALKHALSTLPAEVNLTEAIKIAYATFQTGGSSSAVLANLIADGNAIFPDPATRPFALAILSSWLFFHTPPAPTTHP